MRGGFQEKSSTVCFPPLEIRKSHPAVISRRLVIPAGGIEATLIDGKDYGPIEIKDARWSARIFSGDKVVVRARDIFTNKLRITGIPAGTHRLQLTVRGYDPLQMEFSIAEGEVRPLGEILLEPADGD